MNNDILAIILGGGQGSRLAPLTESRSKPAVPIGGKYRLVDIPISNCINSDIPRMFVLTQFNSASLNQHIKNTYQFSSFSHAFVDILAAEQTPDNPTWFQGTADAVRQCMPHFLNHEFDYALILSGDQLYQMNFNEMLKAHKDAGAAITIATLPVNAKEAPEFGILKTNEDSVITSFIEKPHRDLLPQWTSETSEEMQQNGRNYLASMGIYIFNRDLLVQLMSNPDTKEFGKEIIPQSIDNQKVLSFQYEGYWTDIGNIDSFFEANLGLTDEIPQFNLFDNRNRIYTRARILPPSKITGSTTVKQSIVSEGCILDHCTIEDSVIGIRTRIGRDSEIKKCYIMGSDFYQNMEQMTTNEINDVTNIGIGRRCKISHTIVDKNCRIGNDVVLHGGPHLQDVNTPLYTVKDGIIVVKKGVTIPDGFTV